MTYMISRMTLVFGAILGLASPAAARELHVGPDQRFSELHKVPKLQPGDRVFVHWREAPYAAKLAINVSNVHVVGVAGPNGQLPTLDGSNAVEVSWAGFWSNQIARQGIITVTPAVAGQHVRNVVVEGFRLTNARAGTSLTSGKGQASTWNHAAAGVALYKCSNVTIRACVIANNDNGIFGKSYGEPGGDLQNICVEWCNFHSNGVSGKDRFHNTYIEGIGTTYQFNHYHPPIEGSSGCNLKDRSAGAVVRYNRFEGGVRILDLVDPEDGAPTFTSHPKWGKTYVYGNIIVNPKSGGSTTMIHFGFDGMAKNAQKHLYFYHNTIIDLNTLDPIAKTGRWYAYPFKCNGAQRIHAANNIFHACSPDASKAPGEFRFLVEEYGKGTEVVLQSNWFPTWATLGDAQPDGWEAQMKGTDPGFVDAAAANVALSATSPCRRKATQLDELGWPLQEHSPNFTYDPTALTWTRRSKFANLGAIEIEKKDPEPEPAPVDPSKPDAPTSEVTLIEAPDTGIAGILAEWKKQASDWWPWGLVALDFDQDGDVDLLVQQHGGAKSHLLKNQLKETGSLSFTSANAELGLPMSALGATFKPLVLDIDADQFPDLVYCDAQANTVWFNSGGKGFRPMGYAFANLEGLRDISDFNGDGFMDVGHDHGRWHYDPHTKKFKKSAYTNPLLEKPAPPIVDFLQAEHAKPVNQFLKVRAWRGKLNADGRPDLIYAGFGAYGGSLFGRYLIANADGSHVDSTQALGLPNTGTPVFASDLNRDGKDDFVIVGQGVYLSGSEKYELKPGPLTDFVKTPGAYLHQITAVDLNGDRLQDLVVCNQRGRDTRVFQQVSPVEFKLVMQIGSWDGDPVAVCDIDGDGRADVCVGAGDDVRILLNK